MYPGNAQLLTFERNGKQWSGWWSYFNGVTYRYRHEICAYPIILIAILTFAGLWEYWVIVFTRDGWHSLKWFFSMPSFIKVCRRSRYPLNKENDSLSGTVKPLPESMLSLLNQRIYIRALSSHSGAGQSICITSQKVSYWCILCFVMLWLSIDASDTFPARYNFTIWGNRQPIQTHTGKSVKLTDWLRQVYWRQHNIIQMHDMRHTQYFLCIMQR